MTNIWTCKIGENVGVLPPGADAPMRDAVKKAYCELTGKTPDFLFSGWRGELTEADMRIASVELLRAERQMLGEESDRLSAERDEAREDAARAKRLLKQRSVDASAAEDALVDQTIEVKEVLATAILMLSGDEPLWRSWPWEERAARSENELRALFARLDGGVQADG